jgi:hypothetical protein
MANSEPYQHERTEFGEGDLNSQLDMDSLLDEMGLDQTEIACRKNFIGFDRDDTCRLQKHEDLFGENADQIADEFYNNLANYEETLDITERSKKDTDLTVESPGEMTEQIEEGIDQVEDTMNNRNHIVEAVSETTVRITEVWTATDDQATSSEEITTIAAEFEDAVAKQSKT